MTMGLPSSQPQTTFATVSHLGYSFLPTWP